MRRFLRFPALAVCLLLLTGAAALAVDPVFKGPFLLTSVGRADGFSEVVSAFAKAGLTLLKPEINIGPTEFSGVKTLLILVGPANGSGDAEAQRAALLLREAKTRNLSVIGVYLAGAGGRAASQKLIDRIFPNCNYIIATTDSNAADHYFSLLVEVRNVGLSLIVRINDLSDVLMHLLQA